MRGSSSPKSLIASSIVTMDVKTPKPFQSPCLFKEPAFEGNPSILSKGKENPFVEAFHDHHVPLCKLNLRETSDFVRAFPMARNSVDKPGLSSQKRLEAPLTPGRAAFTFNAITEPTRSPIGNFSRKNFPSKWDDAEKWLNSSGSCHESPAHSIKPEPSKPLKQNDSKVGVLADILKVKEDNGTGVVMNGSLSLSSPAPTLAPYNHGSLSLSFPTTTATKDTSFHGVSSDVLLKDRFTDNVETILPNMRYSEPMQEGFLFSNGHCDSMKDASTEVVSEVHHRDIGTDMTPLGSSRTSRCHTPLKSSSPARHNTPASRSGPLSCSNPTIDISELNDCHFAKLECQSNWSSREEEEEDVSKSLRHFEMGGLRKSVAETRASLWEDEERTKCCMRYQREEAKIQAWVNLQNAKVEAQSRKLEVKIQKMRSSLEEKLMKRMAVVHRRAEEWRAQAQLQHSQHLRRTSEEAQKIKSQESYIPDQSFCGCFPCNNSVF
ncbi:hypothetical protein AMTR_s00129p00087850 [Amborella trichopoda]|uniref:Remorin C-terminal domain-containing protein n=2 Tax=Amborella trichopoda TaxID=13333 RepID=W1NLE8_AMBTC|nr:hypothetical protein AMTR_s00129p00087850 [Amborella trichopoda]